MKIRSLILLVLMFALVTGCAAVSPPAPTSCRGAPHHTVRIGTQPWIGYGPWWIAQEKGMFAKYGIEAELIDFVTDTEVNAAFASGNMDVANVASHTAIKLFANGVDLRVVLLEDVSNAADAILAPSAIATVADLAGKTVAYEEGSTSDLLLNYALLQSGMSLADINPAPMPAADAGAALIAGQVDSAVTYEPYISEAINQNSDIQLLYTAAERSGLISDVLAARAQFAGENPDVMRNLLKVWDEAVTFLRANPEEGRAIIAEAVGSSPEELVTAFDGVAFYNLDENVQFLAFGSENAAGRLQDVQTVALAIGLIDEPLDLDQLVDAELPDDGMSANCQTSAWRRTAAPPGAEAGAPARSARRHPAALVCRRGRRLHRHVSVAWPDRRPGWNGSRPSSCLRPARCWQSYRIRRRAVCCGRTCGPASTASAWAGSSPRCWLCPSAS